MDECRTGSKNSFYISPSEADLLTVVQNLKTGEYLKYLVANILVTHNSSGQFSNFRFSNITVPNWAFSVKYLFLDTAIYEIALLLSSENALVGEHSII